MALGFMSRSMAPAATGLFTPAARSRTTACVPLMKATKRPSWETDGAKLLEPAATTPPACDTTSAGLVPGVQPITESGVRLSPCAAATAMN